MACIQMGISSFTANLSDYKTVRFVQKGAFVLAQELACVVCACVVCARVCVCVSVDGTYHIKAHGTNLML